MDGTGSAQETILDGSDIQFSSLGIQKIQFTRQTLTLDQIADGDGKIRFGDETPLQRRYQSRGF